MHITHEFVKYQKIARNLRKAILFLNEEYDPTTCNDDAGYKFICHALCIGIHKLKWQDKLFYSTPEYKFLVSLGMPSHTVGYYAQEFALTHGLCPDNQVQFARAFFLTFAAQYAEDIAFGRNC